MEQQLQEAPEERLEQNLFYDALVGVEAEVQEEVGALFFLGGLPYLLLSLFVVIPDNGDSCRRFSRRSFRCGGCFGRFWGQHTCIPCPPRCSAV